MGNLAAISRLLAQVRTGIPVQVAQVSIPKRSLVVLCGGPGLRCPGDPEHDQTWASYVTPFIVRAIDEKITNGDELVHWVVFRPAYEARWRDDKSTSTQAVSDANTRISELEKELGQKATIAGYAGLIELQAIRLGVTLHWITMASEFWKILLTVGQSAKIDRVWYYGHGNPGAIWLSLRHGVELSLVERQNSPGITDDTPCAPPSLAVIESNQIQATANGLALSNVMIKVANRRCEFNGCNTDLFAKQWHDVFGQPTKGVRGKLNFSSFSGPKLATGAIFVDFN